MEKIGVLALQGDFAEHVQMLKQLDVEPVEVRLPKHIEGISGLIIPGGESTTITKLMGLYDLTKAVKDKAASQMPIWGTCAGMIVVSQNIIEAGLPPMGLIDLDVRRNAYGRQVDSFETDLSVPALGEEPFHAIFIRAPIIQRLGPEVEMLAQLPDGGPVAARQHRVMVTSFHPELTGDDRFHRYFLRLANLDAGPAHTS